MMIIEMNMDWIPALTTSSIVALGIWLSKNILKESIKNDIAHEYNQKLEKLRAKLRKSDEEFKAEIRAKEKEIEAIRQGALSGIANRQSLLFEKEVSAVESLWCSVIDLSSAKQIAATMAVIDFEAASEETAKNHRAREMFEMLGGDLKLTSLKTIEANKVRPFISPVAWAFYSAYSAIIFHAVVQMHMLQKGINIPNIMNNTKLIDVVKIALPHQEEYIDKYGTGALFHLLEELESKMLFAFNQTLKGEKADAEALEQAAKILSASDKLLNEDRDQQEEHA